MGQPIHEVTKWIQILNLTFIKVPIELTMLFVGRFLSTSVDDAYTTNIGSVLPGSNPTDYAGSVYSLGYLKQFFRSRYLEITKPAQLARQAPNSEVISLDGRMLSKILDYGRQNRPLVLNFGSCTWPPFVAELSKFNRLVDEFGDKADFLTIYIEEAHASDGWKFENNFDINIHRTIEDRIKAAEMLANLHVKSTIVVDTMSNEANANYGGLYERLYILRNGVIEYQGERGPVGYKLQEVEQWLTKYCSK